MSVRSNYDNVVIDTEGNALDNIQVTVKLTGTGTNATIYNSKTGSAKSNPFTTSANGLAAFWAEPGSYDITFTDTQSPARVSARTLTWEAVSGANDGIDEDQIEAIPDGSVTEGKIANNAVTLNKIPDGTITNDKLVANTITDGKLASPPHSLYKLLTETRGFLGSTQGSGTYLLGTTANPPRMATLGTVLSTTEGHPPTLLYFVAADFAAANKTTKLRLRAQVATNTIAPAINFTFGMYPLTMGGGSDSLTWTRGTVVSGSTVALNTPAASTVSQGNSGDFTIPSDGAFIFAVTGSGTLASGSFVGCFAQLQYRNV